jgi:catalase
LKVDFSFLTASSVLFDAVYVPGGDDSVNGISQLPDAVEFVSEAFKHCKAIAGSGPGVGFIARALGQKFEETNTTGELVAAKVGVVTSRGPVTANFTEAFIEAIAAHRHWDRENSEQ